MTNMSAAPAASELSPRSTDADPTAKEQRGDRRYVLGLVGGFVLLLVGAPVLLWWVTARSSASFADTEILDENHLGAATLDIELGRDDAGFEARNLAPGDRVSGHLELVNAGSLPLEFGVTAQASSGVLRDWIVLSMWEATSICKADDIPAGTAGPVLATDKPIVEGTVRLADPLVDPAPALRLAPGEDTTVCLGATLSLDAPNEVQGQQLAIDLIVDATHDLEEDS
jgi:hypothetical protein